MAAYAQTTTPVPGHSFEVAIGVRMLYGKCNLTNYNSTLAEITEITNQFRGGAPTVIAEACSDNGYLVKWDTTSKAFKAYAPTIAHKHSLVVQSGGAIGTNMEVGMSVDTDAATFEGGTGIAAVRTLATNSPIATLAASAGVEVANDVDVGEINFIAIGPN